MTNLASGCMYKVILVPALRIFDQFLTILLTAVDV